MLNINVITSGMTQTNCYVLNDSDEAILIDFVPEAVDFLLKNNFQIKKIFLTHIHYDHIFGLSDFQNENSFELILSEDGRNNINNSRYNLSMYIENMLGTKFKDIYLNNSQVVHSGDVVPFKHHKLEVINSPGHSSDSLMYILREMKLVFTGDTIFKNSIGRTDLSTSDDKQIISSIKQLFNIVEDEYVLYPGHGDHTTVSSEKKYNPFIIKEL